MHLWEWMTSSTAFWPPPRISHPRRINFGYKLSVPTTRSIIPTVRRLLWPRRTTTTAVWYPEWSISPSWQWRSEQFRRTETSTLSWVRFFHLRAFCEGWESKELKFLCLLLFRLQISYGWSIGTVRYLWTVGHVGIVQRQPSRELSPSKETISTTIDEISCQTTVSLNLHSSTPRTGRRWWGRRRWRW